MREWWIGVCACLLLAGGSARSQDSTILLWPDAAGDTDDDKPRLTVFRPLEQTADMAVIVCPGGGYQKKYFGYDNEGVPTAEWLAERGILSFILTYRCSPGYLHPYPALDGKRAVRHVRAHAAEWHVDPDKIGMLGFSAGAHLATTVGTRFDAGDPDNADPVEQQSCKPDFMILNSSVISMRDEVTHPWTRAKLLGDEPALDLVLALSNELQVTPETPPTFVVNSEEDTLVKAMNSLLFAFACDEQGVPVKHYELPGELHSIPITRAAWGDTCLQWLETLGMLPLRRPGTIGLGTPTAPLERGATKRVLAGRRGGRPGPASVLLREAVADPEHGPCWVNLMGRAVGPAYGRPSRPQVSSNRTRPAR